jgi:hypothetical protein
MSATRETIPGLLSEESTPILRLTMRDEAKQPILASAMTSIKVTGFVRKTEVAIGLWTKRETLNLNGGTYHATSGLWELPLGAADMAVQDQSLRTETHAWLVEWYWGAGKQNRKLFIMHIANMPKVPA